MPAWRLLPAHQQAAGLDHLGKSRELGCGEVQGVYWQALWRRLWPAAMYVPAGGAGWRAGCSCGGRDRGCSRLRLQGHQAGQLGRAGTRFHGSYAAAKLFHSEGQQRGVRHCRAHTGEAQVTPAW